MDAPEREVLRRYIGMIQIQRGDFNGRLITIRAEDVRALARVFERDEHAMRNRIEELGHQDLELHTTEPVSLPSSLVRPLSAVADQLRATFRYWPDPPRPLAARPTQRARVASAPRSRVLSPMPWRPTWASPSSRAG